MLKNAGFKFHSIDDNNSRIYYRYGKYLYCWQYVSSDKSFQFFKCNKDGELMHPVVPEDNDVVFAFKKRELIARIPIVAAFINFLESGINGFTLI